MIEKLLMKLAARDALSPEEEAALRDAAGEVREIPADRTVIRAGEKLDISILLLDGLMCRYKDLRNGSRQISELHVPGDFLDLHSFTLKRLEHSIMALTPARVVVFPHARLKSITENFPHLTRMLWFTTNLDAAIHREWVVSLGLRTAMARIAHFICELFYRLRVVGLTDGHSFRLDLTQADVGECLGLTSIHVNRTLRELREGGLVTFRQKVIEIHDLAGLERVAEFSTDYLFLDRVPQ